MKNQWEDAFKPEIYGNTIIIERRILESFSFTTVKNSQGKKIGTNKEDLREIVEHFNGRRWYKDDLYKCGNDMVQGWSKKTEVQARVVENCSDGVCGTTFDPGERGKYIGKQFGSV